MNEKKKYLYVSLLPLIIIVLLIIGAGYFLLADDIKLPKFNKGPQIRRLEGFPTTSFISGGQTMEKQRRVIKSEKELVDFLNSVDKSGLLTMRDKIDFNKEFVIAVATEVEQPDNHRVKIKKVYEDKATKTLLVSIQEIFPADNCKAEINPHVGVDIVAINKTDWTIDFERVKEEEQCSSDKPTTEETAPQSTPAGK